MKILKPVIWTLLFVLPSTLGKRGPSGGSSGGRGGGGMQLGKGGIISRLGSVFRAVSRVSNAVSSVSKVMSKFSRGVGRAGSRGVRGRFGGVTSRIGTYYKNRAYSKADDHARKDSDLQMTDDTRPKMTKVNKAIQLIQRKRYKMYYRDRSTVTLDTKYQKLQDVRFKIQYYSDPRNIVDELCLAVTLCKKDKKYVPPPLYWRVTVPPPRKEKDFSHLQYVPELIEPFRECQNNTQYDWTYNPECSLRKNKIAGPNEWSIRYPECSGFYQSPVKIDIANVSLECSQAAVQTFIPYESGNCKFQDILWDTKVEAWGFKFNRSCKTLPSFQVDGDLYHLQRVEFTMPSEHIVYENSTQAEMRMFIRNSNEENSDVGIAVGLEVDPKLKKFTYIDQIWTRLAEAAREHVGNETEIVHAVLPLNSYIDPLRLLPFSVHYMTYYGSLPYPPCTENIRWVVYPTTLKISGLDFNVYKNGVISQDRGIYDAHESLARSAQPLYSRQVMMCEI